MLFLPGNSPKMIINGGVLGADSIIFDLEDAVAPSEKDAARVLVREALKNIDFNGCEIIVRINSLDTPFWKEDLEEIIPLKPDVIMPTKVNDATYICELDKEISRIEENKYMHRGSTKLIPLIETAKGIENSYKIALASKRIEALYLGAEDLTADFGCSRTKEGKEIDYARGRLLCAARAAGIDAYDTPFTDIEDLKGLEKDSYYAKGMGYTGKAVIHPSHVEIVNKIFSPTEKEILYAQEILKAIEDGKKAGKGAVSLHRKMIDAPIVERAKRTLSVAEKIRGGV